MTELQVKIDAMGFDACAAALKQFSEAIRESMLPVMESLAKQSKANAMAKYVKAPRTQAEIDAAVRDEIKKLHTHQKGVLAAAVGEDKAKVLELLKGLKQSDIDGLLDLVEKPTPKTSSSWKNDWWKNLPPAFDAPSPAKITNVSNDNTADAARARLMKRLGAELGSKSETSGTSIISPHDLRARKIKLD